jgi:type IV pilus modification protein PilV
MKRQEQHRYNKKDKENGFTLIEVLIAVFILSVGLLGMASLTVGIINGNKFSNDLTTATILAQDKMEDIRRLGYSGTSATTTTITENYNSITNYTAFKRVTVTTVGSPAPGMKTITVTAFWQGAVKEHSVELKTILN